MKKIGRNDTCICGSGKKFKKCCESKMIGGRYLATKAVAAGTEQVKKVAQLSSFFQGPIAQLMRPSSVEVQQNSAEKENIC